MQRGRALVRALFLVCTLARERGRESAPAHHGAPPSGPNYLPKDPPPTPYLQASTLEFGGAQTQSVASRIIFH